MRGIGSLTEEYQSRMYKLPALYAKPLRHDEPVPCIEEKNMQLISHSRKPFPMVSAAPTKQDNEYVRKGTTDLFVALEPRFAPMPAGLLSGQLRNLG